MARALYADADIYLLDDILSAVDIDVGKFLMRETIVKFLKGKTVIMPTHAVTYLNEADNIIVMKKGKIIEKGTLIELQGSKNFEKLISAVKKEKKVEEEE